MMSEKRFLKIKSRIDNEREYLMGAKCSGQCGAWWPENISPTSWAQDHTLATGHHTIVYCEKTWQEVYESVEEGYA